MIDLSARIHTPEMMDDPSRPASEFDAAYRELGVVNRRLGGNRAVVRFLPPRGGTLLDVAAGGSDLAEAIAPRGTWSVTALDLNLAALRRVRAACRVRGDAFALPFRDGAFDVVVASLFFHHLTDDECVTVLRGMRRVARRRIIVNELHRRGAAYYGITLLTRLFGRSPMVRNDGPLSVRRGFRPPELGRIASAAGLTGQVVRSFPYRLVLVADTPAFDSGPSGGGAR
jgi:SAM-dependent methyltransferase